MRRIDSSMKVIVRALVRWSWLLVICLAVGWFGGKELGALLPPTYQATAIVKLNAQAHTTQVIQPIAAYATLVTSDSEVGQVLKQYPQIDRTNFVAKQLVVTSDSNTGSITIQVTLPNAKEAADLSNQLAQSLVTQQNAYISSRYNTQLQLLTQHINDEQKAINDLNQKIIQTPSTDTTAIQQYQSQVSQDQNLQTQDINQKQSLLTEQALYSAPLSIIQTATPPTKPSTPLGQVPLTAVALAVALLLGLVAISFLEQNAGRINGVFTLQKTGISGLGALRWTSPSPQTIPLRVFCNEKTAYTEDCRIMMADVLFHAEEAHAHIIALTGMKDGVGTSSTAAQLAALLAQSKRRILLVDANLSEPVEYKRLGISNDAGLASMLADARNMILTGMLPAVNPLGIVMGGQRMATVDKRETMKLSSPFLPAPNAGPRSNAQWADSSNMQNPNGNGNAPQTSAEMVGNFPFDSYIIPTEIKNLYAIPAWK